MFGGMPVANSKVGGFHTYTTDGFSLLTQ